MPRAVIEVIIARVETKITKEKTDCSSFKGVHAYSDCKLADGNKTQTQLNSYSMYSFMFTNSNDDKYDQTGVTVKNLYKSWCHSDCGHAVFHRG